MVVNVKCKFSHQQALVNVKIGGLFCENVTFSNFVIYNINTDTNGLTIQSLCRAFPGLQSAMFHN